MIQPLFSGPLDVVGDVHGEIEPLRNLLWYLGYDTAGKHPEGRRLVFVGDLTDRGPDSPAVVRLVRELIEAERAQCVMGNHDFNLLLRQKRYDNGWFFREVFHDTQGRLVPQRLADAEIQQEALGLFGMLPLALEREDVRIVHACWHAEAVEMLRNETDVVECYERHRKAIDASFANVAELTSGPLPDGLGSKSVSEAPAFDEIERNLRHQNDNPVKLLTSGPERRAKQPYFNSGWHTEERVVWWRQYAEKPWCLFGHYGNPYQRVETRAVCVDYGIAKRWKERRIGRTAVFKHRLAAFRFPERRFVFDDGEIRDYAVPLEG